MTRWIAILGVLGFSLPAFADGTTDALLAWVGHDAKANPSCFDDHGILKLLKACSLPTCEVTIIARSASDLQTLAGFTADGAVKPLPAVPNLTESLVSRTFKGNTSTCVENALPGPEQHTPTQGHYLYKAKSGVGMSKKTSGCNMDQPNLTVAGEYDYSEQVESSLTITFVKRSPPAPGPAHVFYSIDSVNTYTLSGGGTASSTTTIPNLGSVKVDTSSNAAANSVSCNWSGSGTPPGPSCPHGKPGPQGTIDVTIPATGAITYKVDWNPTSAAMSSASYQFQSSSGNTEAYIPAANVVEKTPKGGSPTRTPIAPLLVCSGQAYDHKKVWSGTLDASGLINNADNQSVQAQTMNPDACNNSMVAVGNASAAVGQYVCMTHPAMWPGGGCPTCSSGAKTTVSIQIPRSDLTRPTGNETVSKTPPAGEICPGLASCCAQLPAAGQANCNKLAERGAQTCQAALAAFKRNNMCH